MHSEFSLDYDYPQLHRGKEWYVWFNSWDPQRNAMRRKRIKLNHIKDIKQRKRYAQQLIYNIMYKLDKGWNPWIPTTAIERIKLSELVSLYRQYLQNCEDSKILRPLTHRQYKSMLNCFTEWLDGKVVFADEITRQLVIEYLDEIHITRKNTTITRNNYQVWIGMFLSYAKERGHIKSNPISDMKLLQNKQEKSRKMLPSDILDALHVYLEKSNPHFLLLCKFIMYCFVRPKELCMLRVRFIDFDKGTLTIPADISKNHKTSTVTIPDSLLQYMKELGYHRINKDYYLFGKKYKPCDRPTTGGSMCYYWRSHVANKLGFPPEYKLYSLKDTGITKLLHNADVLSVRDQARHSNISITNIYAQRSDEPIAKVRKFDAEL